MVQFLMSRLQASAISWSSFSACRNSRGLPTDTARVKRCMCSIRASCFFDGLSQHRIVDDAEAIKTLAVASQSWTRPPNGSHASVHFYCALGTFVGI